MGIIVSFVLSIMLFFLADMIEFPFYLMLLFSGINLEDLVIGLFFAFILSFFSGFIIGTIYKKLFSKFYHQGALSQITLYISIFIVYLSFRLIISENPEYRFGYKYMIESGYFKIEELKELIASLIALTCGFLWVIKPSYFNFKN